MGMEGGKVMDTTVMGFWGSMGPVLIGYKLSLGEDFEKDRKESNLSYGSGGYLNQSNKGDKKISSFNINYDVVSLFFKQNPLKLYLGFFAAEKKQCPVYWTSEMNYFYRCPNWEKGSSSGLDMRIHYNVLTKKEWSLPITCSFTNKGDFVLGAGYSGKF